MRAFFRRTGFLHRVALGTPFGLIITQSRETPGRSGVDHDRRAARITLRSPLSGWPQLQQVVNRAQNSPFTAHLGQTTQRKLPEAQHLLQLAEDRLDDPLPLHILRAAFLRPQLPRHPLLRRKIPRDPTARCLGNLLVMLQSLGRHIGIDPTGTRQLPRYSPRCSSPCPSRPHRWLAPPRRPSDLPVSGRSSEPPAAYRSFAG